MRNLGWVVKRRHLGSGKANFESKLDDVFSLRDLIIGLQQAAVLLIPH
jgi:hypothetical protein